MTELSKMPGYKTQEAEDRGLQALVNLPKMERAQFMEALKAKPPVTPKAREMQTTQHDFYTLPGGENYREILLQHPNPQNKFAGASGHFAGAPNILASVRAKDRVGPNGEKILHIDELQSDWHQQGREHGYRPPGQSELLTGEPYKIAENEYGIKWSDGSVDDAGYSERYANGLAERGKLTEKVPDAPFKKNWHEMALKKMIHHAAANGYDSIAITPGAEQAKRYGLSKQVGRVAHMTHIDNLNKGILFVFDPKGNQIVENHNVFHKDLPRYIGKEGTEKLLEQKPDEHGYRELSGQNLEFGGEGMKGFYDKMIPSFLNQFGKKYGAKVSTVPIESGEEMVPDNAGLGQIRSGKPNIVNLHHFPITPEMREDVTKNGVPLYAKGGEVEVKPTSYDPNLQRRHPELEAAIRGIAAGTTTHKQLDKLIAKHKPIKPYEFVPKPATLEDAQRGLNKNQIKAWRAHEDWPEGTSIGGRLDINAYEHHGVWANSIHDESGEKRPTSYGPVISIKNVTFDPNPGKSEEVGTGEKRKSPFARIKGELHHMTEDEAVQHMVDNLHHPDYAQVGYDPRRHGHFYDRKTLQPVTHSPHVVQIGPLALAHKPTYGKRENYAKGGEVSRETAMGINVRSDKKANLQYADLIVDGQKTYESRNGDTLRPYVGKRVSIVRTGDGPAKAIGAVTVGEPIVVDRKKFRKMEKQHLVPEGSAFDIASGTKHLYPMHEPERYESERDVGHGIVARKVHMADGGPVPPLRPLNPQLAALREQMAAQSALHKAYDEAMKNVYTNQMPTFAQWVASQGKAKGGAVSRETHDANLAKFLKESKVKYRTYHATQSHDDYEEDSGAAIKQFTNLANWVAKEPYTANTYAGKSGYVMPVHINVKKPLLLGFDLNGHLDDALKAAKRLGVNTSIYSDDMEPYHVVNSPEFIEAAMKRGYDGITAKESGRTTHAVFDPRMIKSAIGNRGTYDPTDPDITKANGGSIKPVGYTKEQVTVSPNLDAMRYELMSVKRYTKKVK
jgi:hypothetical protein